MKGIAVYKLSDGYLSILGRVEDVGFTPLKGASLYSFSKAKVLKKDNKLGGFFVDTAWGEAFMPLAETKENRRVGDEIVVQVIRESVENKPPRVGERFILPLKGCEITTNRKGVLLASSCGGEKKAKLLNIAAKKNIHIKVWDCDLCLNELKIFENLLENIFRNLPFKWFHFYTQLLEGGEYLLSEDRFISTHLELFKEIFQKQVYWEIYPLRELVRKVPPSEVETLTLNEKVPFDGGYLLIKEIEGLVFVDVNGYLTSFELNTKAGKVLLKLMRLRKWGGLIAVDFVNFRTPAERERFKNWFKKELIKTPCKGLGFTNGGVYEILCPRRYKSLLEVLTEKKTTAEG